MPVNIYEPCSNPITKETYKTISFNEAALIMQWTVQSEGYVPLEHIHIKQRQVKIE